MKNIIFFEAEERENLLPLTFTKPVSELRMGGLTFKERWQKILSCQVSDTTQDYLSGKFPIQNQPNSIFINPAFFPNQEILFAIENIKENECLIFENHLIASTGELNTFQNISTKKQIILQNPPIHIQFPWDMFSHNFTALEFDFNLITKNKISEEIPESVTVIGEKNKIFIEQGATLNYCSLNTKNGSIYIGKNAEIMEGSHIRGNLFLGENSKINMGSKIYSGTTIGPNCKIGGEVNNSIIMGYSNKGHEGFLGNSIIGEWCNLGADTNTSNMKNNYDEVKSWNYKQKKFIKTGLQFSGLIMGDHSKTAINTQFNTGTVCGVSANIFCEGFPPNIIKHFSWGGTLNSEKFKFEKAVEVAERMMKRRDIILTNDDLKILSYIYEKL